MRFIALFVPPICFRVNLRYTFRACGIIIKSVKLFCHASEGDRHIEKKRMRDDYWMQFQDQCTNNSISISILLANLFSPWNRVIRFVSFAAHILTLFVLVLHLRRFEGSIRFNYHEIPMIMYAITQNNRAFSWFCTNISDPYPNSFRYRVYSW